MADAVRNALDRLQKSATALNKINQVTDMAAAKIREAEVFLETSGVGIPHYVKFGSDVLGCPGFFGYRRFGRNFRVVIVYGNDPESDDNAIPWVECGREEKLNTFPMLPVLLNEIAEKVEKQIVAAAKVVQTITDEQKGGGDDIPF